MAKLQFVRCRLKRRLWNTSSLKWRLDIMNQFKLLGCKEQWDDLYKFFIDTRYLYYPEILSFLVSTGRAKKFMAEKCAAVSLLQCTCNVITHPVSNMVLTFQFFILVLFLRFTIEAVGFWSSFRLWPQSVILLLRALVGYGGTEHQVKINRQVGLFTEGSKGAMHV